MFVKLFRDGASAVTTYTLLREADDPALFVTLGAAAYPSEGIGGVIAAPRPLRPFTKKKQVLLDCCELR